MRNFWEDHFLVLNRKLIALFLAKMLSGSEICSAGGGERVGGFGSFLFRWGGKEGNLFLAVFVFWLGAWCVRDPCRRIHTFVAALGGPTTKAAGVRLLYGGQQAGRRRQGRRTADGLFAHSSQPADGLKFEGVMRY